MKLKLLCLIWVSASLLLSCSKEEHDTANHYLVFGHTYGKCVGEECLEVFKLTQDSLFEDLSDNFFSGGAKFVSLSKAKHSLALPLLADFPQELKGEVNRTFGCPGCHDQATIIIQYFDGVKLQQFLVDEDKPMIPVFLHAYVEDIQKTISDLK